MTTIDMLKEKVSELERVVWKLRDRVKALEANSHPPQEIRPRVVEVLREWFPSNQERW